MLQKPSLETCSVEWVGALWFLIANVDKMRILGSQMSGPPWRGEQLMCSQLGAELVLIIYLELHSLHTAGFDLQLPGFSAELSLASSQCC